MKVFHCDHCQHLVFFESVECVSCHSTLGYAPDLATSTAIVPLAGDTWRSLNSAAGGLNFRKCANYEMRNICNWVIRGDDPFSLCLSCRLTTTIPDLSVPGHRNAWYRLEAAKRRLVYTLLSLGLETANLRFEFKADFGSERIVTGHDNGTITINVVEADDAVRERTRVQLHEPYRTLLGHFRHESGHYYWDHLIEDSAHLGGFRALFGDERFDYTAALQRHYSSGAPQDWPERFVSAYASSHPWEDWAESWAHYLHMVDALETASACGLSLNPSHLGEPSLSLDPNNVWRGSSELMFERWYALTYAMNNLNRGLGHGDSYPFVLSSAAIEKVRFVHGVVSGHAAHHAAQ